MLHRFRVRGFAGDGVCDGAGENRKYGRLYRCQYWHEKNIIKDIPIGACMEDLGKRKKRPDRRNIWTRIMCIKGNRKELAHV